MMHPDHVELIKRLMNFGMALICGKFLAEIVIIIIQEIQ